MDSSRWRVQQGDFCMVWGCYWYCYDNGMTFMRTGMESLKRLQSLYPPFIIKTVHKSTPTNSNQASPMGEAKTVIRGIWGERSFNSWR